MDGISHLAGERIAKLTLAGREYTLTTQTLEEYSEREQYILSLKPDPMALLSRIPASLDLEQRQKLEDRIFRDAQRPQVVSIEDEAAFDNSIRGQGWRLWRALRKHHPEIDSVDKAIQLMEQAGAEALEETKRKLDRSEEKDLLGNSPASGTKTPDKTQGQTTAPTGQPQPPADAPAASHGPSSIAV